MIFELFGFRYACILRLRTGMCIRYLLIPYLPLCFNTKTQTTITGFYCRSHIPGRQQLQNYLKLVKPVSCSWFFRLFQTCIAFQCILCIRYRLNDPGILLILRFEFSIKYSTIYNESCKLQNAY